MLQFLVGYLEYTKNAPFHTTYMTLNVYPVGYSKLAKSVRIFLKTIQQILISQSTHTGVLTLQIMAAGTKMNT